MLVDESELAELVALAALAELAELAELAGLAEACGRASSCCASASRTSSAQVSTSWPLVARATDDDEPDMMARYVELLACKCGMDHDR